MTRDCKNDLLAEDCCTILGNWQYGEAGQDTSRYWCLKVESIGFGGWLFRGGEHGRDV